MKSAGAVNLTNLPVVRDGFAGWLRHGENRKKRRTVVHVVDLLSQLFVVNRPGRHRDQQANQPGLQKVNFSDWMIM